MTTADGSFELFQPPGQIGYLIEGLEGGQFYGRRRIEFPKTDDSFLDIELPAADTVRGRVIDKESGKGVPAVVQVRPQTGRLPDGEARWWRLADVEGRFQFDLEPGEYFVGTVHQTYAPAEKGFTHSGPTSDLTLEIEHTPSIAGQVVDPAGGELRGLVVTARGDDGRDVCNSPVEGDGTLPHLRPPAEALQPSRGLAGERVGTCRRASRSERRTSPSPSVLRVSFTSWC